MPDIIDKTTVKIPQVEKNEHVETVLNAAVAALHGAGFSYISFLTFESTQSLEYNIRNPHAKILFSNFMNQYLGLSPNQYLFGSGSHRLPSRAFLTEEEEPITPLIGEEPTYIPSDKLLVCTNLIDNQYFGGKSLPILCVLDRIKDKTGEIHHHQDPILYQPIKSDNFSTIRISLLTDSEEYVSFSKYPTTAVLVFRPKNGNQV